MNVSGTPTVFWGVLLGNRSQDNDLTIIWEVQETYGAGRGVMGMI